MKKTVEEQLKLMGFKQIEILDNYNLEFEKSLDMEFFPDFEVLVYVKLLNYAFKFKTAEVIVSLQKSKDGIRYRFPSRILEQEKDFEKLTPDTITEFINSVIEESQKLLESVIVACGKFRMLGM